MTTYLTCCLLLEPCRTSGEVMRPLRTCCHGRKPRGNEYSMPDVCSSQYNKFHPCLSNRRVVTKTALSEPTPNHRSTPTSQKTMRLCDHFPVQEGISPALSVSLYLASVFFSVTMSGSALVSIVCGLRYAPILATHHVNEAICTISTP